jgi:hypothetical protein
MSESALSSLKLARIAALSFWTTARSSAIVFAARTFRINCLTAPVVRLGQLIAPEEKAAQEWRHVREVIAVARTPGEGHG